MSASDFVDIDGRFRYVCEAGHHSVTSDPNYRICTAVLPWPGGEPCGAEIDYRVVPMRVVREDS